MVDALGAGDIICIVRKGGIRDRHGFTLRHDRFVFYPTRFHQSTDLLSDRLRPRVAVSHEAMAPDGHVRIEYLAHTAMTVAITDLAALPRVHQELGLSMEALHSRFHYREPGLTLAALRVERLHRPIVVPEIRRYAGCVSWLELDDSITCDSEDVAPVLSDAEFQERLHAIST